MTPLFIALLPLASCEIAAPEPHVIEPAEQAVDELAPGRVSISGVTVSRGRGPALGCSDVTSCDDLGIISLVIDRPTDDRTPQDELGYRLALSLGELPAGLTLPDKIKAPEGVIDLVWVDEATDAQDAFAFEISIAAVDLADNFGPFSTTIRVEHPGGLVGCGQSQGAPLLLLLLGLALFRRPSR